MALPLSGVRVLDLTRALSGPFCTMVLADLGAEVVKVEPGPGGDMIRQWGPFDRGVSAYYLSSNRNKLGLGLDFRKPEGLALLRELALKSDIVVENFKPGTMRRMGLDYETLSAGQPGLVYASITGFGSTGPAGDWPGFDQIAQGYSGLMSVTGMPETGPVRVGVAIGDLTAGMWAAMGVLAAWIERQRDGRGQRVETSLLASLVGLLSVQGQRYLSLEEIPQPTGNVHPVIAPYGAFETADGPLNLAPATQEMWLRLCELLELTEAPDDARYKTNADRMLHRDALKALIESRLRQRDRMHWTREMIARGIPAGPINTLADVFSDPQVRHCRMVETAQHPELGQIRQLALPIAMDALAAGSVRSAPPVFGQHTRQILRAYDLPQERIDALCAGQVVFQHEGTAPAAAQP
ncbi:MAG TPA: CoA transferase [Bordetella sp.]|nr:CoA transferase [Bordetella sp.]